MSEQAIPIQRKHLPVLDAVRGVAILCVFLYHLLSAVWGYDHLEWGSILHRWPAANTGFLWFYPFTFGSIGVSLFFVLSGFVIHYSTLTSSQPYSTLSFYSRRFWRIYPPYAVALLIFCVFRTGHYAVTPLSILTHIFLIQDFSGQTFYLINPSFWSIGTEVQFYLVYPLLMLARGRGGMFKVLLGVLGFSLLSRLVICALKFHHPDVFDDTHHMMWASPMITILDWTLGVYLAERFSQGKRIFPQNVAFVSAIVAAFLVCSFVRPLSIFSFQVSSLLGAVFIERAIWSTRPASKPQKWLAPLGLCSYSFYLFHQPLLDLLMHQADQYITANRYLLTIVMGPVLFGMLFGLSWVIYNTVEKTSINLGKRFSFKPRSAKAVTDESGIKPENAPAVPALV